MADPYLDALERILRGGVLDLHDAAKKLFPSTDHDDTAAHDEAFSTTVNTFNNGLLKGWWSVELDDP